MSSPRKQGAVAACAWMIRNGGSRIATKTEIMAEFTVPESPHEYVRELCRSEFFLGWREAERAARTEE